jgi:DNA polymerase-3 subunit delta'
VPFRDLVGQLHARAVLQGALRSGRIAHAYLFVGPRGVGRRTAAHALAQALLCAEGGDDACGACAPCRKVASGTHPDLRVIAPGRTEAGAERRAVAIDQIRDLKRDAAYPPYEGRWKIYIVEHTEQMRAEAANSLLKVLEEPCPSTLFILIAESTEALLPTLASRAQPVRFTPVPPRDLAPALVARGLAPARAQFLAAASGGRVEAALAAAEAGEEAVARREDVLATLRVLEGGDVIACLDAAEAVARQKDELEQWLDLALLWFRDLAVWRAARDPALLANADREADVARAAGGTSPQRAAAAVDAIGQAREALRRNVNPRLVLETLFTRLAAGAARPAA